jgi:hypothetical protein
MWVNLRVFVPDAFGKNQVSRVEGVLEMRLPARERWELPFSYIIDGYSFAPFEVPNDVELEVGQEYIVYYLTHTRRFLSIEPK